METHFGVPFSRGRLCIHALPGFAFDMYSSFFMVPNNRKGADRSITHPSPLPVLPCRTYSGDRVPEVNGWLPVTRLLRTTAGTTKLHWFGNKPPFGN